MLRDPDALTLLGRQYFVATRKQLLDAGISARRLEQAVRSGTLERCGRGVVRLSAAPFTFEARATVLCLACGPSSYLSGTTAGHLWGVRGMTTDHVEITVAHATKLVIPDWGRLVRSSWLEPELHRRERGDGLALSSPLRTLMRLAESCSPLRFEKAAEDLWHRRLIDPSGAKAFLEAHRRSGRGGVTVFDDWLERAAERRRPAQSHAEVALARALVSYGLPEPVLQHPLRLRSGRTIHIDLAYPAVRLAIEPGASWWHGGDDRARADQTRDRACAELGWAVLRFDEVALADIETCARECAAVYFRRSMHRAS